MPDVLTMTVRTSSLSAGLGRILSMALAAGFRPARLRPGQSAGWWPRKAPTGGNRCRGNLLGAASDTEIWRAVRQGVHGTVSIPDRHGRPTDPVGRRQLAGLPQRQADRHRHRGPCSAAVHRAGALLRRCAAGSRSTPARAADRRTLQRRERFAHWLTAVSFIVLA